MPSLSTKSRSSKAAQEPQLLLVDDLSAGIDLRRTPSLLKPNRARRLRNWSLREAGALVTAYGWTEHTTASLGDERVQGGQRIYLADTTPFTLAAWDGDVYKPSDAGVWGSPVLTGINSAHEVYFTSDRDMVAVFDGVNAPQKSTNGTTWTAMGIAAPTTAPTGTAVAGGSLISGDVYRVSYSYQDDALVHEGNESATVDITVSGANLTARVTVTGSADPQVDTINIYVQDTTIGESVRRKVGSVANPASTTTFDITTNNWSSNAEAPVDHDVPEPAAFGVIWKNRWWMRDATVKNRLRFTQIFDPQSAPALYYIDIPFERGDEISALLPSGDTLVVFGQASKPFLILGQTSLDFEVRPSAAAEAGALGPRAVALVENGLIHAAAEGVYIFDGASDRLLSYDIDPGWQDLVHGASVASLERVAMVYHRTTKELRIAVPRLYPYGTPGEWVLDLNRTRLQETPAWTSTDRTIGGYIYWDGNEPAIGDRGRLFSWHTAVGRLYEEATGTDANGDALVADYEGPAFVTGLPMARFTDIYAEYEPSSGAFGLNVLVDRSEVCTLSLDIGAGVARYDTAVYGTATYAGAGRRTYTTVLPLEAEGRSIVVQGTYTGTSPFRWFTYGLALIAEPLPRGF